MVRGFNADIPNFWERPEMSGYLRDVRTKPDKYAWLNHALLDPPRIIAYALLGLKHRPVRPPARSHAVLFNSTLMTVPFGRT